MVYYSRKSARIPGYPYSTANYYFITICTHNRRCIFGDPHHLNAFGKIAQNHILRITSHFPDVQVDQYVVMPNHVHMIIILQDKENVPDIPTVVSLYKAGVTREIRTIQPDRKVWQRSFHDHVIRNQKSYEKIWLYIEANPQNWEKDTFYMEQNFISAQ